jgi:hypothetical protein
VSFERILGGQEGKMQAQSTRSEDLEKRLREPERWRRACWRLPWQKSSSFQPTLRFLKHLDIIMAGTTEFTQKTDYTATGSFLVNNLDVTAASGAGVAGPRPEQSGWCA